MIAKMSHKLSETRLDDPELSLVLPCYNEEKVLELAVRPLVEQFAEAQISLQLILVDNGSCDRTAEVIDRLIERGYPITKGVVPVNQGQGLGILSGLQLCRGRYAGWICADGQVAPEDVVTVYRALKGVGIPALAKAFRRTRKDGWVRKLVSIGYNVLMKMFFIGIPSFDTNSNPKIMPIEIMRLMELSSRDWFLEAETMLKARYLKLPVIEVLVEGKARQEGRSHVRFATVLEFLKNMLWYRFGGPWQSWRHRVPKSLFHSNCISARTPERL